MSTSLMPLLRVDPVVVIGLGDIHCCVIILQRWIITFVFHIIDKLCNYNCITVQPHGKKFCLLSVGGWFKYYVQWNLWQMWRCWWERFLWCKWLPVDSFQWRGKVIIIILTVLVLISLSDWLSLNFDPARHRASSSFSG